MTNADAIEGDLAKRNPAPPTEEKRKIGTGEVILIAIGILAVAALITYQFYGCSGCYAGLQG